MKTKIAFLFLPLLLLGPKPTEAQTEVDLMSIGRNLPLVTRAELEESLAWHQTIADSAGVDGGEREKALEAMEAIQRRLETGDFRAGDQIVFFVEGEEEAFPDTLVVERGPLVLIPNVGEVSLDGVLRSELQDHLADELSRYLRNPVVRAMPTIRLTMAGYINQPGFYTFPAGLPIGEAIMAAGGPARDSRMESIRVRREGAILYGGEEVDQAIAEGQTFDQLGLRPGDEIYIPEKIFTMRRIVTYGLGAVSFLLLGFRFYGGL